MKLFKTIVILSICSVFAYAGGKETAISLKINASEKASKQWEKLFTQDDKMEKLGISKLSQAEKDELKDYLIKHAADSEKPEAAGI